MEAALKSSVRKEMALRATQPVYDEFLAVTTVQNGFSAEDFSVDDLLDLSNDDVFAVDEEEEAGDDSEPKQEIALVSSEEQNDNNGDDQTRRNNDFSASDDFVTLPSSEQLSLPADDLANLEWLSHFVEDSFTEYSAPNLTGAPTEKPAWLTGDRKHPVTPVIEESCFKSPVPAKTRTKRYRNGVKIWSLGSSSSSGPSSSSSTSSSSSGPSSPWFSSGAELLEAVVTSEKPSSLKKHKKRSAESVFRGQLMQPPRRCSHCGVQKTPQWRAGPMGAKTLCNACGVRFKSGRLLPEYRPACSPTFSSELHSNHHRKVMEMRRKKEPTDGDNETGLNQLVQSPQAVPSF